MKLETGKVYFVRTENDHYVGRLKEIDSPFVVTLEEASWVANSGRLSEFIKNGRANNMEIEPVGTIMIHWRGIIPWPHKLFKEAI